MSCKCKHQIPYGPYETTPVGRWDDSCLHSFYRFLDENMDKSTTVPDEPPYYGISHDVIGYAKAFMYNRCWVKCKNSPNELYFEIHPETPDYLLHFRVWCKSGDKDYVRAACTRVIREISRNMNRPEIIAPAPHPRSGQYMRFAAAEPVDWLGRPGEFINKEKTLEILHIYERILKECAERVSFEKVTLESIFR